MPANLTEYGSRALQPSTKTGGFRIREASLWRARSRISCHPVNTTAACAPRSASYGSSTVLALSPEAGPPYPGPRNLDPIRSASVRSAGKGRMPVETTTSEYLANVPDGRGVATL
jgi:hypothetical protein